MAKKLFQELDVKALKGTIVGVPVVNVPSLLRKKRRFIDDADLNHIMSGKPDGNVSPNLCLANVCRDVTDFVKKGDLIATIRNIFGDVVKEYFAPEDGIVIGKSASPINQTGGRVLHLGIL